MVRKASFDKLRDSEYGLAVQFSREIVQRRKVLRGIIKEIKNNERHHGCQVFKDECSNIQRYSNCEVHNRSAMQYSTLVKALMMQSFVLT